ncbi:Protein cgi121 [Metarhizium acridum CQMa 102]|uniref:EKC/KEOPS complex subunit CGI121 n=1 Tax=Metarhizium acridum (strain CQMa 102) TaxID=655827 RepID=E9E9P5_METAQ|nr:Protein cgi121 [Metarhizium acridum CQMa 102]EFY87358.1 Protein cgi121 [Metarhizium acridum CQMa 102]
MTLEALSIEHIPPSYKVYLGLYQSVHNADFLHQQLLSRNADFEYAFVDASVAVSRRQLLSAVFKAVTAATNGSLKTPNVHSEIVVSLNPSNNITDSYRRFGISPTTKNLVVIKVTYSSESPESNSAPSKESIQAHLAEHVKGTPIEVTDANIAATTDISKVRKYYKLNGLDWLEAIEDEQKKRAELDTLVVSAIALRGL